MMALQTEKRPRVTVTPISNDLLYTPRTLQYRGSSVGLQELVEVNARQQIVNVIGSI